MLPTLAQSRAALRRRETFTRPPRGGRAPPAVGALAISSPSAIGAVGRGAKRRREGAVVRHQPFPQSRERWRRPGGMGTEAIGPGMTSRRSREHVQMQRDATKPRRPRRARTIAPVQPRAFPDGVALAIAPMGGGAVVPASGRSSIGNGMAHPSRSERWLRTLSGAHDSTLPGRIPAASSRRRSSPARTRRTEQRALIFRA